MGTDKKLVIGLFGFGVPELLHGAAEDLARGISVGAAVSDAQRGSLARSLSASLRVQILISSLY